MLCEADEYCSLTHIIGKYIMLKVSNGQSIWVYIAKYDPRPAEDAAPAPADIGKLGSRTDTISS